METRVKGSNLLYSLIIRLLGRISSVCKLPPLNVACGETAFANFIGNSRRKNEDISLQTLCKLPELYLNSRMCGRGPFKRFFLLGGGDIKT